MSASKFVDPKHYSLEAPHRQFFSTDDVAVFLDDTLDESTVRCISSSPSAIAILSPQRLSATERPEVDLPHSGGIFSSLGNGGGERLFADYDDMNLIPGPSGHTAYVQGMSMSAKKKAHGGRRLADVTNGQSNLSDSGDVTSTPTPPINTELILSTPLSGKKEHRTPSQQRHTPAMGGLKGSDMPTFTPKRRMLLHSGGLQPHSDATTVPLGEWERVERERSRYQKMYEHQRSLYDDMAQRHQDAQQKLQDKIVEVVALSTRNEESKRFIRQLKKEIGESRTRVLDMSNRQLEERKNDRNNQGGNIEKMRDALEEQYSGLLQERDVKMAGLEGLLRDLTQVKGESARLQVSQLDQLLKASYAKNAALFGDLFRQNRQLESLMDNRVDLERTIDQLRRERREFDTTMATERRLGNQQNERFLHQVQEQQQMITELRQMLVRTMENAQQQDDDSEEDEEDMVCVEEESNDDDASQDHAELLTVRHRRSPYDEGYVEDNAAAHTPRAPSNHRRPQLHDPTPGVLVGNLLWDKTLRPSSRPGRAIPDSSS